LQLLCPLLLVQAPQLTPAQGSQPAVLKAMAVLMLWQHSLQHHSRWLRWVVLALQLLEARTMVFSFHQLRQPASGLLCCLCVVEVLQVLKACQPE
jgi:tryptophan-rich sensory protein